MTNAATVLPVAAADNRLESHPPDHLLRVFLRDLRDLRVSAFRFIRGPIGRRVVTNAATVLPVADG